MAKKRVTLVDDFQSILNSGDFEAFKNVFKKCDINARKGDTNVFGCRPLPREFAFWLKEQGCDIEYKDNYDETPIFKQVTPHEDNFDLFVELGADIFAKDKRGLTLLHATARWGNQVAMEKLMGYGFDINLMSDKTILGIPSTPLEYALIYGCSTLEKTLTLTEFMVGKGANLTEKAKETITKKCEDFAFRKDSLSNEEFVAESQVAYEKLFALMGAEAPEEVQKHDGISDIAYIGEKPSDIYNNLWEFLVPGSGRAKSGQGECIRLIGRLSNEILNNVGMNWCSDFKLMAKTFGEYLKSGEPLEEEMLVQVDRITKKISKSTSKDDIELLMLYAVAWIGLNPKVMPLIEAEYVR